MAFWLPRKSLRILRGTAGEIVVQIAQILDRTKEPIGIVSAIVVIRRYLRETRNLRLATPAAKNAEELSRLTIQSLVGMGVVAEATLV